MFFLVVQLYVDPGTEILTRYVVCVTILSKRTITYIIHTTRTKEGRKRKERTTDCVISTVLPKEKKTEEDYSSDSIGTLTTDGRKTKSGETD